MQGVSFLILESVYALQVSSLKLFFREVAFAVFRKYFQIRVIPSAFPIDLTLAVFAVDRFLQLDE